MCACGRWCIVPPVGHHLDEALGLEQHVDVWDDLGAAQHALQTVGLQDAVQLGQQEEHRVHESAGRKQQAESHRGEGVVKRRRTGDVVVIHMYALFTGP